MDFYAKFRRQARNRTAIFVWTLVILTLATGWALYATDSADTFEILVLMSAVAILSAFLIVPAIITITEPVRRVWQAVQHVSPHGEPEPAPSIDNLHIGKELVSNLVNNIYQLASVVEGVEKTNATKAQDLHTNFVANSLPLPMIVLNHEETIVYVNAAAVQYLGVAADELEGKNAYTALDMSFVSDATLTSWLKETRHKSVTANTAWERVRIGLPGQKDSKQFDMAAHYNKSNPMGYETLLVLFDHTDVYSQDDQAMSFVALGVHELRTPLTLLRGYIEVFDEELGPKLTPELKSFMQKMDASAQQLSAFVDNILNVAKVEDNQLTLTLHEEQWKEVLMTAVQDLSLRAAVRGITIKTDIAEGLPAVGVDRYSIYEVIANLLDNAIKYSKGTSEIYVTTALNKDGLIETSVKDFGLGIDGSILPHIFDKFYRNHRNRAQIGGTGLGLYLSHAIVQAHGGQIWVNSKVDEGSTFTFTLVPYEKLAQENKSGDTTSITRGAHGWIKNHSLYRD